MTPAVFCCFFLWAPPSNPMRPHISPCWHPIPWACSSRRTRSAPDCKASAAALPWRPTSRNACFGPEKLCIQICHVTCVCVGVCVNMLVACCSRKSNFMMMMMMMMMMTMTMMMMMMMMMYNMKDRTNDSCKIKNIRYSVRSHASCSVFCWGQGTASGHPSPCSGASIPAATIETRSGACFCDIASPWDLSEFQKQNAFMKYKREPLNLSSSQICAEQTWRK